ncbi:MAG: hypothetical protein K2M47_01780 [Clostridiales bacterium]|nr:hypothetical protein [Clostridiales bacterium]
MRRSLKGLVTGLLITAMLLFGVIGCATIDAPNLDKTPNDNRLAAVAQSSISASLNGTQLTVQWGAVESAEKYVVTFGTAQYVCNAPTTQAVFNNVEYVSGSLTVTIVARATGYKDSATTTYTFTPGEIPPPQPGTLATPTGFAMRNGTLSWNKVQGATSYTVSDGTKTVSVSTNSIDLAANGLTVPTSGSITYTVVAKADGYTDSAAAPYTYTYTPPQPTTLAMPTGLFVGSGILTWSNVTNATSYTVSDGTKTVTVNTNSIDLAANGFSIPDGAERTYTVIAKASGYNDSPAATKTHTFAHEHTFAAQWSNNKTHHWHVSTCGDSIAIEESDGYGAHEFNGNTCSVCAYTRSVPLEGQYVNFGEYPQTLKAEDVTVSGAADANGYYTGSDGAKYAKVTATPFVYYQGFRTKFSNGEWITSGTEYYFKVEPIKWRVLEHSNGSTMLFCDSIIDHGAYYNGEDSREIGGATVYPSNYEHSDIRAWLNGTFYSTAFNSTEKNNIKTTTVNNGVDTTGYSENPYVCENTQDKIFLLSNRDAYNTEYWFITDGATSDDARMLLVSDYARAIGAHTSDSIVWAGCGIWWMRSPMWDSAIHVDTGSMSGMVSSSKVSSVQVGIAPAMRVDTNAL